MFDAFDRMIAGSLGVSVDDYIKKIESIDEDQREEIIGRLISDNDNDIIEGKKMFEDIDYI